MAGEIATILNKIEHLRRLMNDVARDKKLTDPEVVNLSQTLDQVLNDYQALVGLNELAV